MLAFGMLTAIWCGSVAVHAQSGGTASSNASTSTNTDLGSATFEIYQFRRFVPEIGVGATFGFVTRPKYGTSTNAAGQTTIAKQKDDRVSVDPTVMVNFVPWGVSGATPMAQVGASASKTSPAVFVGGGWRVLGTNGGFALGLGLMLAWVKDLQTLSEGSVVKGTKEIDDDLAFDPQPRPRFYFNLQYKF